MHWWPSASGRRKKKIKSYISALGKKEGDVFLSFSSLSLLCFHLAANIQWSEMNGPRAQLAVLVRGFLQLCDRSNGVGIRAELVFHHSCCRFLMLGGFLLFLLFFCHPCFPAVMFITFISTLPFFCPWYELEYSAKADLFHCLSLFLFFWFGRGRAVSVSTPVHQVFAAV